jgi:ADP-ribose pyrophosphatase
VVNGYRVINYTPFNSSQNCEGYYPIMVQAFLCTAEGELLTSSNETQNLRWIPLQELGTLLEADEGRFYPMHIVTLKKYVRIMGR